MLADDFCLFLTQKLSAFFASQSMKQEDEFYADQYFDDFIDGNVYGMDM